MSIAAIVSGLCAAALLAIGWITPIGGEFEGLCEVAGVASAVVFFGLVEGA